MDEAMSAAKHNLRMSITGTQEQSDAVFGGVTDYDWFPWGVPGRAESGYGCSLRDELIPEKDYPELEQRMAIFHTGHTRASMDVNAGWTKKLATKAGGACTPLREHPEPSAPVAVCLAAGTIASFDPVDPGPDQGPLPIAGRRDNSGAWLRLKADGAEGWALASGFNWAK